MAATWSTGHGGGLIDRARSLLRQYGRNRRLAVMDFEAARDSRAAFERHAGRPPAGARVLDLGCGQRFPAVLLFRAWGATAVGIDSDVMAPSFAPRAYARMIRANGVERFLKSLARQLVYDREYYRELRGLAGRSLSLRGADLRVMDARRLEFPDAHFDFVHSVAVFEHLADVPRTLDEMARVLKPGGLAWVAVHLFASLSGGHQLEWAFPDEWPSRRVPPWDHLREGRHPTHVHLNRWREGAFLEAFRRRFEVVETSARTEGERFLTPALERALAAWPREELLKREMRVVLRRVC